MERTVFTRVSKARKQRTSRKEVKNSECGAYRLVSCTKMTFVLVKPYSENKTFFLNFPTKKFFQKKTFFISMDSSTYGTYFSYTNALNSFLTPPPLTKTTTICKDDSKRLLYTRVTRGVSFRT